MTDGTHGWGPAGPGRRSFLRGATTTLLAAGAVGTSVTAAAGRETDAFHTRERRIESWDGTELAATLYVPDGEGPFPAMLLTHGWGMDRQGSAETRLASTYARNGFLVLTYDSRGFGESGGEVGVDGPKEVNDAQHLITWLANLERDGERLVALDGEEDPKVGMDGLSYAGGIQLNTAAADDRLDAIVPRWAWHDLTDSLVPNGVVKAGWASLLYGVGVTGARGATSGDDRPDARDAMAGVTPRLHEIYLQTSATNRLAPQHRAYFRLRSPAVKADGLGEHAPPTLLIGGWNDTLFPPNEAIANRDALDRRGVDARLLLFEGGHTFGPTPDAATQSRIDAAALSLADALGGGEGTSTTLNSPVPTSNSQIAAREQDDHGPGTFVEFDFRTVSRTEILGVPELTLDVTPLGREARLFAKLHHVTDDGEELIYGQATPYLVEGRPGEGREVTFDLAAVERTLAAGDRLRLSVATTDAGFHGSRESAGARIRHAGSTLRVPVASGDGLGVSVDVTRSDDGAAFTGGTDRVTLDVAAERPVLVRDRTPEGWRVVAGDPHERTAPPETDANYVAFTNPTADGTRTYLAEAPDGARETGRATFGPVEFSLDGATWFTVPGSTDGNALVGTGTGV